MLSIYPLLLLTINRHFLKCLLCTRHCAKFVISMQPCNNTVRKLLYLHFTKREAKGGREANDMLHWPRQDSYLTCLTPEWVFWTTPILCSWWPWVLAVRMGWDWQGALMRRCGSAGRKATSLEQPGFCYLAWSCLGRSLTSATIVSNPVVLRLFGLRTPLQS